MAIVSNFATLLRVGQAVPGESEFLWAPKRFPLRVNPSNPPFFITGVNQSASHSKPVCGAKRILTSEFSLLFWFAERSHLPAQFGQTARHRLESTVAYGCPDLFTFRPVQPNISVSQVRV